MGGVPCVRGMRVTARAIHQLLEAGIPREDILRAYPYLEAQDLDEVEHFAQQSIHFLYVPRDKHDIAAVNRAIAAGYPANAAVIPELLEWIQDMNWSVAQPLSEYLAKLGPILIPHLGVIFQTDDHIWKRNVIHELILASPELTRHFEGTLEKLAALVPKDEDDEDLRESAENALRKLKGPDHFEG